MATKDRGYEAVDEQSREIARSRVDHVVVLMLENRSFDHLLGDVELEDVDRTTRSQVPNPLDLNARHPREFRSTEGANELVWEDPPHSYHSAVVAMEGKRAGRGARPMSGFVHAYRLKLAGKEHLPTIHWWRVALASVPTSAVLALATIDVRELTQGRGVVPSLVLVVASCAGASWWTHRRRIHHLLQKPLATALAVANGLAAVVGLAIGGIVRLVDDPGRVLRPSLIAWGAWLALALVGVGVARFRLNRKLRPDPSAERDQLAVDKAPDIMRTVDEDTIPVLSFLAKNHLTFTRWHSSVPGATWPNRNFLHAATSEESVDIEAGFYLAPTVFERLEAEEREGDAPSWAIYRDGVPQVIAFPRLWDEDRITRWYDMAAFFEHVASGTLPKYAFIEPAHSGEASNSFHPGNNRKAGEASDFQRGERLVAEVYDALTANPELMERTLLVITFDEHGGWFDHVVPAERVPHPNAEVPEPTAAERVELGALGERGEVMLERISRSTRRDHLRTLIRWFVEHRNAPFDFRRLGPRVPTIAISPWLPVGTDDRQLEHASLARALIELLTDDPQPLTERDRTTPSILDLLARRPAPRTPPPLPPARNDWAPEYPSRLGARPATAEAADAGVADVEGARAEAARAEAEVSVDFAPPASGEPDARTGGDLAAQLEALDGPVTALLETRFARVIAARRAAAPEGGVGSDGIAEAAAVEDRAVAESATRDAATLLDQVARAARGE